MQIAKRKVVLEHLVVRKMGSKQDLKQDELDDILRYGAEELFEDEFLKDTAENQKDDEDNTEASKQRPMRVREVEAARMKGELQLLGNQHVEHGRWALIFAFVFEFGCDTGTDCASYVQ